uniref:Uncharacterized protein n=1 Tax=Hyaloperonospora arabidopsidis (strain Emoy2) TaxID=559515 RepID=M4BVD4_HYAAE
MLNASPSRSTTTIANHCTRFPCVDNACSQSTDVNADNGKRRKVIYCDHATNETCKNIVHFRRLVKFYKKSVILSSCNTSSYGRRLVSRCGMTTQKQSPTSLPNQIPTCFPKSPTCYPKQSPTCFPKQSPTCFQKQCPVNYAKPTSLADSPLRSRTSFACVEAAASPPKRPRLIHQTR